MKKILILGSSGFIGKSLTEYFFGKKESINKIIQDKYTVITLSHSELNLLDEGAVRDYFKANQFDIVIHAAVWNPANASPEDKKRGVEMDLRMFLNVARCSHFFGRMIYFGSGAEYDKRQDIINVKEDVLERNFLCELNINLPATEYGLAKAVINQLIINSDNIYNLRIFGLYGKYEDYRVKFITGCCAKAVLGLPLTIRQNVYFDFLYIDDFCRMIDGFVQLDKPKYHSYNIVSGKKVDLLTLAECVKKESGKDLPIYMCNDGFGNEYTANGDRLHDEIDYHDFITHQEAIKELLAYFDARKNELDIGALLYQG